MTMLKQTIDGGKNSGGVDVEIDIQTRVLKFQFYDEDEKAEEVLIINNSARLYEFLGTFFKDIEPVVAFKQKIGG